MADTPKEPGKVIEMARLNNPPAVAPSDQDREDRIRRLAHTLWEQAGCPAGAADDCWYRAEAMVDAQPRPQTTDKARQEIDIDDALEDTFPASDPPATMHPAPSAAARRRN